MPFLNPDRTPKIHHPSGHPIEVITSFKTTGEMIPLYFRVTDDNEERFTYQINSIKSMKDKPGVKVFVCTYLSGKYKNDIVLMFDESMTRWTIG